MTSRYRCFRSQTAGLFGRVTSLITAKKLRIGYRHLKIFVGFGDEVGTTYRGMDSWGEFSVIVPTPG